MGRWVGPEFLHRLVGILPVDRWAGEWAGGEEQYEQPVAGGLELSVTEGCQEAQFGTEG